LLRLVPELARRFYPMESVTVGQFVGRSGGGTEGRDRAVPSARLHTRTELGIDMPVDELTTTADEQSTTDAADLAVATEAELLAEPELLVEEVSIDGMCGVY
jgi:mycofactocin precursor